MREFTKEEISLCKQVAERHRKKVEYGDWYLLNNILVLSVFPVGDEKAFYSTSSGRINPLWTISDCLEFLEKEGFNQDFHFKRFKNGNWSFTAENKYKKVRGEGKARRASCLKAVLAMLEEEGK